MPLEDAPKSHIYSDFTHSSPPAEGIDFTHTLEKVNTEIYRHERVDNSRSYLQQGAAYLRKIFWDKDDESLKELYALRKQIEEQQKANQNKPADTTWLALLSKQADEAIKIDKEKISSAQSCDQYISGAAKTASLFARGGKGVALTIATYALDETKVKDNAQGQSIDFLCGVGKAIGMRGASRFMHLRQYGPGSSGAVLGFMNRAVDGLCTRENYYDREGKYSFSSFAGKAVNHVFNPYAIVSDIAIGSLAHGSIGLVNKWTNDAVKRSQLLSTMSTSGVYGFSSGLVSSLTPVLDQMHTTHLMENGHLSLDNLGQMVNELPANLTEIFHHSPEILKDALMQGSIDALAAIPGGLQARRAHNQAMREIIRDRVLPNRGMDSSTTGDHRLSPASAGQEKKTKPSENDQSHSVTLERQRTKRESEAETIPGLVEQYANHPRIAEARPLLEQFERSIENAVDAKMATAKRLEALKKATELENKLAKLGISNLEDRILRFNSCPDLSRISVIPKAVNHLIINRCDNFTEITRINSSIKELIINSCPKFKGKYGELPHGLQALTINNCPSFDVPLYIPDSVTWVEITYNPTLTKISHMSSTAQHIRLTGCNGLLQLPEMPVRARIILPENDVGKAYVEKQLHESNILKRYGIPQDAINLKVEHELPPTSWGMQPNGTWVKNYSSINIRTNPEGDNRKIIYAHEAMHAKRDMERSAIRQVDFKSFSTRVLISVMENIGNGGPRYNFYSNTSTNQGEHAVEQRALLTPNGRQLMRKALLELVPHALIDQEQVILSQGKYAELINEGAFNGDIAKASKELRYEYRHLHECLNDWSRYDGVDIPQWDEVVARRAAYYQQIMQKEGSLANHPKVLQLTRGISDSTTGLMDKDTYRFSSLEEYSARRAGHSQGLRQILMPLARQIEENAPRMGANVNGKSEVRKIVNNIRRIELDKMENINVSTRFITVPNQLVRDIRSGLGNLFGEIANEEWVKAQYPTFAYNAPRRNIMANPDYLRQLRTPATRND